MLFFSPSTLGTISKHLWGSGQHPEGTSFGALHFRLAAFRTPYNAKIRSLFGALDVAADTQGIRVDKIGSPAELGAAADFDVSVVLRDRSSGEEIQLRNSLTAVVTDTVHAYNFWTTHPIQPSTTYQVAVRKQGREITTATMATPALRT